MTELNALEQLNLLLESTYQKGYDDAMDRSHLDSMDAYNSGYDDGYEYGYEAGLNDAKGEW